MDVLGKLEKTEYLGRDFLIWLWFKSEKGHGLIDLGDQGHVEIRFDGKITLEKEDDDAKETVACSGVNSRFKEARLALRENKKVTKAGLRLILGDDEFRFTMDSRWMNFNSFKTPKVVMDPDDDSQGVFYEKAGLIEKAVTAMDNVFMHYLNLRLSSEWEDNELPGISRWIRNNLKSS